MCATAVANRSLVLDLLEWIGAGQRPYADVMEAWRTSCPRLSIWEDALDNGFVACVSTNGAGSMVEVTPAGRAFLHAERQYANGEGQTTSDEPSYGLRSGR